MTRAWRWVLGVGLFLGALGVLLFAQTDPNADPGTAGAYNSPVGMAGALCIVAAFVLVAAVIGHYFASQIWGGVSAAFTDTPSPYQIQAEARRRLGRPLSNEEMAMVLQEFHNKRTEAQINLGILIGTLAVMHHWHTTQH